LTAAQIAAAAEAAAKAATQAAAEARAAEIAVAQTKLATVLKGDKAGTIGEYSAANIFISTTASLARVNAEVLKLSANDRSDFTKIKAIVDKIAGVEIKRAGNKIAYAIHNLNETYGTYELDENEKKPGRLLEESLDWHVRNFKMQSIDGCLMSSYALLIEENEEAGIKWDNKQKDKLAKALTNKYNTANKAQLEIKKACLLLDKSRPGYVALDSNYVVSNGLKYLAKKLSLPTANDQLGQWTHGF
jgi:hypothetical protein